VLAIDEGAVPCFLKRGEREGGREGRRREENGM
jgi:hypothetical protein